MIEADVGMTRNGMEITQYDASGKKSKRSMLPARATAKPAEMTTLFTRNKLNALLYEHVAAEFSACVKVRWHMRV